jgi:hypothetical protein
MCIRVPGDIQAFFERVLVYRFIVCPAVKYSIVKKITTENTEKIVFKALSGQLAYGAILVSSAPLGLVFDPEAQTRRELVAERLNVADSVPDIPKAFGNRDCGFILFFKYII